MRLLALISCAFLVVSCSRDQIVSSLPPDLWIDTYGQESASKVDVLWVIDNSGSMVDKQVNLGRNFQSFIDLFTRGKIDFRIAVTTTDIFGDAGQLKGSPKILTPTTSGLAAAFANNIKVGVGGSAYEAGLKGAEMALDRIYEQNQPKLAQVESCRQSCKTDPDPLTCQRACPGKYPVDFLRPDAWLYVIFVTDDEDRSDGDIRYYWRKFETVQGIGNDAAVTTAAIVGRSAQNGCNATEGKRYTELSALTEGEVGDICDAEFAVTLRKLATSAVGLRRKFALSKAPNPDTIEVYALYRCDVDSLALASCETVDKAGCEGGTAETVGISCTPKKGGADGWSYDAKQNLVFFSGDSVPYLNAQVELRYYPEGVNP
jgi:hypothetical protein